MSQQKERFPAYLDRVLATSEPGQRAELDRIMGKLVDAQKLSTPNSPIGKVLYR